MFGKTLAALSAIVASSAILSACGGALTPASMPNLSSAHDNRTAQQLPHGLIRHVGGDPGSFSPIAMYANTAGRSGSETMAANTAGGFCGIGPFRDYIDFGAKGHATGPFAGKFDLSMLANINNCPGSGTTLFYEGFTIFLGTKQINGSASGAANYHCPFHFECYLDAASGWTYTATLTRAGKVLKTFSGSASESGGTGKSFSEILNAL